MTIDFRLAKPTDTDAIASVRYATWPDESIDREAIQSTLMQNDFVTVVAFDDQQIVGYLSCFPTMRPDNILYWEHDQLAVHPDYRRRGIARDLIARAYDIGFVRGNDQHRAWIQINNSGSQAAFRATDFQTDQCVYSLYICLEPAPATRNLSAQAHLISVQTLSYGGYWLEGDVQPSDFAAARAWISPPERRLVGMMIPVKRDDLLTAAQAADYIEIEHFHRWWRA